ncbi:MAG: hypothetical protein RQ752_15260, partial [Thermohalobaculum sp.]|nr:hypothetical protein [Thermohalobaculum sp.]
SPWFHHDSFLFLSARRAVSGTGGVPDTVLARAALWDTLPDRETGSGDAASVAGAVDADHAPGGTMPWDSPDAFAFL